MLVSFLRLSACVAIGFALLGGVPSSARQVSGVRPDDRPCHFKHNLCVKPKHVKLSPGFSTSVTETVPNGNTLTNAQEQDNCQGMAIVSLDQNYANFAIWTISVPYPEQGSGDVRRDVYR